MPGSVGANIAGGSDPSLFGGAANFFRPRLGIGCCAGDEDREPVTVVIAREVLRHLHRPPGNGDTDIALVGFVACRRGRCVEARQKFVIIGEAHPFPVGTENVKV